MISKMNDKEENRTNSDFSIDHILNRAGNNINNFNSELKSSVISFENCSDNSLDQFSWLQCTRYCPPKIPRSQKREGPQRRQLGRHPRIPFTSQQLSILEEKFQQSQYLSSEEVITLSRKLHLADIRVKIWFQNRRARERRERPSTSNESLSPDQTNKQFKNYHEIPSVSDNATITHNTMFCNTFQSNIIRHNSLHEYFEKLTNLIPGISSPENQTGES